jgi:predicted DNA-binding transcriptional regulator AlpA
MRASDQRALRDFDVLPDAAQVRLPVVLALFSISRATVWRWTKTGALPDPIHIGGGTFWKVGELREKLRSRSQPGSAPLPGALQDDSS